MSAAAFAILLLGRSAHAMDVGEIALVPDDGTIISNALWFNRYVEHAACAFYKTHADQYDALFVWTSAQLNALTRTQQGWPTHAAAKGIGFDDFFNTQSSYCATRLRHAVKMGDIDSFSDDPDARYTGVTDFTLTGIQLMGHEFGHQWMVGVSFKGTDGMRHCKVRGFPPSSGGGEGGGGGNQMGDCDGYLDSDFNLHWSFYFNSGSVMYGNVITDLGGGMFQLTNPNPKYGPLDEYLMGLRDPSEVPPMFLVDMGDPSMTYSSSFPLAAGDIRMIMGERLDFTIDDVIRDLGPRVPSRDMCHWKAATMIVYPPGTPPTPQQIARVDTYRRRWETWYADATDQRGSFDTTLAGTGLGTSTCPGVPTPPPPTKDAGLAPDGATGADGGPTPHEPDASVASIDAAPEVDASGPVLIPGPPAGESPDASTGPRVLKGEGCGCRSAGMRRDQRSIAWLLVALVVTSWGRRRRSAPARSCPCR